MLRVAMERVLVAICIVWFAQACSTRPVTPDSVSLAETIVDKYWSSGRLNDAMGLMRNSFELDFLKYGVSEVASKTLADEYMKLITKEFSKDFYVRHLSVSISQSLTTDEVAELQAFMQRPAWRKYEKIQNTWDSLSSKFDFSTLMDQACRNAIKQLGQSDQINIGLVCRNK